MYSIAKKYDVSIKDLAAWNDLRIKDGVRVGKKLVILNEDEPKKSTRLAKSTDKSKAKSKDKDQDRDSRQEKNDKRVASKDKHDKKSNKKDTVKRISYEVKRGDTLYSIGQRYNVSVSQIKNWNKASKSLKPGQDLVCISLEASFLTLVTSTPPHLLRRLSFIQTFSHTSNAKMD